MKTLSPVTNAPVTAGHVTSEAGRRPATAALDRMLRGPLARPVMRMRKELDALVQDGSLLGVELDPKHPDCPCFLLSVAPDKPLFYMELFRGDLDDAFEKDEEVPLCVLMNWLGSDTETRLLGDGMGMGDGMGTGVWRARSGFVGRGSGFRGIFSAKFCLWTRALPWTPGGTASCPS